MSDIRLSPERLAAFEAAAAAMAAKPYRPVTTRRIEAAIATLGDLAGEEHDELDGSVRDEISHVIHVLEQITTRRKAKS